MMTKDALWRGLPAVAGITVAGIVLVLWWALLQQEQRQIERVIGIETAAADEEISRGIESRVQALIRMAARWEQRGRPTRHEWEADAELYLAQQERRMESINRALEREVEERRAAEQAVARHAQELAHSNAELEQFAYVASHDLQEPLRIVSGYVQLLERRYRGRLDADADEFIHYTVDAAVRMQALISDLLAYSRLRTRQKPPAAVDCNAVLEQTKRTLQPAIAESGAVITADLLPTVTGDDTQLGQLFLNLLGNAIKYRSEAEV